MNKNIVVTVLVLLSLLGVHNPVHAAPKKPRFTPTPTATNTPIPSPTLTPTFTPSPPPTNTPSPTPTNTPMPTPTETPSPTPLLPHESRGIWVAYKGNNTVSDLQKPHIKGVMVYQAWKNLYIGESQYNWAPLDADLDSVINQAGKKAYIEVTGGYCPGLDWPQFLKDNIAEHKELNGQGCYNLQFWDPLYIQYYQDYIQALALHLAQFDSTDSRPLETDIVFVKSMVMANTMENLPNDSEINAGKWKWTNFNPAPTGRIYEVDLTNTIKYDYHKWVSLAYQNELKAAYLNVGLPPAVGISKGADNWNPYPDLPDLVQAGIWLDDHNNSPNPIGWYYDHLQYAKTGLTRSSSEAGYHDPQVMLVQANYWQILAALNAGQEFITIYGNNKQAPTVQPLGPVNYSENTQAMNFANTYAGTFMEPSSSAGAFIALRGFYPEHYWSRLEHDHTWSDYGMLMRHHRPQDSVALYGQPNLNIYTYTDLVPVVERSTQNPWMTDMNNCLLRFPATECEYIQQTPPIYLGFIGGVHKYTYPDADLGRVLYCGDTAYCTDPALATRSEEMVWARSTDVASGHNYMRFDLDNRFTSSLTGMVRIRVVFLDKGTGSWDLQTGNGVIAGSVTKSDTNIWKEIFFDVDASSLNDSGEGGTDLALFNNGDDDDIFHMIEIQRTP